MKNPEKLKIPKRKIPHDEKPATKNLPYEKSPKMKKPEKLKISKRRILQIKIPHDEKPATESPQNKKIPHMKNHTR